MKTNAASLFIAAALIFSSSTAFAGFSLTCEDDIITVDCDSSCDIDIAMADAGLFTVIGAGDSVSGTTRTCHFISDPDEMVFMGSHEDDSFTPDHSLDDVALVAYGGDGDDYIQATGNRVNTLHGGNGDDHLNLLSCDVHGSSAMGNNGHDTLWGTYSYDDLLKGGKGDDTIVAYGGNDTIIGNRGHDTIDAGDGDDIIHGGSGNDSCDGGSGSNTIHDCE